MLIGFVLVLSMIGIAIAMALYSSFLPYFSLLSDIKNYNMAYYGANTAIERSLSVLRYQEAGFESTGGWNKATGIYYVQSDAPTTGFGYFLSGNTTLQRSIVGRPSDNSLPGSFQGNIEPYFLSGDSNDWNMLSYGNVQRVPLWVDNTSGSMAYVSDSTRAYFTGSNISLRVQLISSARKIFSGSNNGQRELDEGGSDIDGDGVVDDIVVSWGRKGMYNGQSFSIIPRSLATAASGSQDRDESIREVIINTLSETTGAIIFGDNINPLYSGPSPLKNAEALGHLIIGDSATIDYISGSDFNTLLQDSGIRDQELSLSLSNPLFTQGGSIYPFLEYQMNFSGNAKSLSQPYFLINAKSQVGQYTVQMNIKKPTTKDNSLSLFTVVL